MPRNAALLPRTVRAPGSLEQLPVGTTVTVLGRRSGFTYRRSADGWEMPGNVARFQADLGVRLARALGTPMPRPGRALTSAELAGVIAAFGGSPAIVGPPD